MTRYMLENGKRVMVLLFCLFTFLPFYSFNYTKEDPLIIAGDWDFRPFEFINSEGKPAGYNVDVLNMILDQLDIPHKFVMQEWYVATDKFKRGDADLIHALHFFYKDHPYVSTHKYINYYNLKVARRSDMQPLHRLSDLQPTDTVLIKEDDYAAMALADMSELPFITEFHSPKEGLAGISHGRYKYYIWGEIPLTHKIQELGLDSIVLDEIDIPAGELRIIGYDKELVDIIDDQYTRLEQAGELQNVYDRWFHPERQHDDTSPMALFILGGLLMAAIGVSLLIWFIRRRVGITLKEGSDLGKMMNQVLNMGDYFVVEWDFKSNMLRNKYGDMIPHGEMKPEEFLKRMPPEEAKKLHTLNTQLATGVISHFDMNLSFNQGTHEQPIWKHFYGNAFVEREDGSEHQPAGKPKYILYTTKDITAEVNEERRVSTVASKYKKMFDTNLVAMSFYDVNGNLLDFNKKMRELCQIEDDGGKRPADGESRPSDSRVYFGGTSLFSFPNVKGIYAPGSREVFHACQHLYEPQLEVDKYTEFRIRPVMNDNDELVYYIVTSRDITAERNMYLEQRQHDRQLHAVNAAARRYEKQLSYLLEESQMYIWNYKPAEKVVNLTRTPGQTEFSETIDEYLQSVNADYRKLAADEMSNALKQGKPYNTILLFDNTPLDSTPTWYSVSGIPIRDKEGKITEYFGLSRNITELMRAQEKLRVETARAQDSGRQKAAFLANMTHEIRTPLNAIVGFSDVLPLIDDTGEKKELMRIIRNNCDMLLRLTSDILEASGIGSRPMYIDPTDVDFAKVFDDICQTLQQRVVGAGPAAAQNAFDGSTPTQNAGDGTAPANAVKFIKDNPYKTFPTHLDKGRMQQVVTNFVTNAVKYTTQGHIRVGYRYTVNPKEEGNSNTSQKGLYIYCQDTGAGIPKEKQGTVFDRFVKLNEFVQGTGLGLNICRSIAERCGGSIGVISEGEGKGSTFWIWVPCPHLHQK